MLEIIAKGFGETGKLIASFQMSDQLAKGADVANQLAEVQEQIEAAEIWDRIPMVEQIASRLDSNQARNLVIYQLV